MFEKGRQSRASKMPGTMFLLVGALTNCRNAPIKKKQKFSRIWPLCRFSCLRFSPKSGRVFGPRQTNFILPSLRNDDKTAFARAVQPARPRWGVSTCRIQNWSMLGHHLPAGQPCYLPFSRRFSSGVAGSCASWLYGFRSFCENTSPFDGIWSGP